MEIEANLRIIAVLLSLSLVGAVHNCGHEQLVNCARPLSFITESGFTFVTSRADLQKICPDLKDALKCIHSYTRMCMTTNHRKHFKQLFHGTSATVYELCDNSTYQEEYLRYVPCMKEVDYENQLCFEHYSHAMKEIQKKPPPPPPPHDTGEVTSEQTNMQAHSGNANSVQSSDAGDHWIAPKIRHDDIADSVKDVCCTFHEYVQCLTQTTRRACGNEAAEFSRNFLDRMSSSMIKMHCSEYGVIECGLSSSAPVMRQTLLIAYLVLITNGLHWLTDISRTIYNILI